MDNKLGELLVELRGKTPLRVIAEKTGLSHTYIRDIELNRNRKTDRPIRPSRETIKKFAEVYDYSYEEMLSVAGYEEEKSVDLEGFEKWITLIKTLSDEERELLYKEVETKAEFIRFMKGQSRSLS